MIPEFYLNNISFMIYIQRHSVFKYKITLYNVRTKQVFVLLKYVDICENCGFSSRANPASLGL
jgi:hypothetical protein